MSGNTFFPATGGVADEGRWAIRLLLFLAPPTFHVRSRKRPPCFGNLDTLTYLAPYLHRFTTKTVEDIPSLTTNTPPQKRPTSPGRSVFKTGSPGDTDIPPEPRKYVRYLL